MDTLRKILSSIKHPPAPILKSGAPGAAGEPAGLLVEVHFRNNGRGNRVPASVCTYSGDMEKVLLHAQHESGQRSSKSSHYDSPSCSVTPQDAIRASQTDTQSTGGKNGSQSEEDYTERRKEVESILNKNSNWIRD